MDLSEYRSSVVIDDQPGTWNPLRGDTSLSKANIPRSDIEFPFLVAQVDYNPELYLPILRTLYKVAILIQHLTRFRNLPLIKEVAILDAQLLDHIGNH